MNKPKFWDADKILSITAFLISVGTFLLLGYQTHLIRIQQYASALPYLEMWNSSPTQNQYKLILGNNGVGPAFVKEVKIHYKKKAYPLDPVSFYHQVIWPKDTIRFLSSNLNPGQVIPAGHQIELVIVGNSQKYADKLKALFNGDGEAELEVVYSSIYDEVWQKKGMMNPPEKLE